MAIKNPELRKNCVLDATNLRKKIVKADVSSSKNISEWFKVGHKDSVINNTSKEKWSKEIKQNDRLSLTFEKEEESR